MNYDSPTNASKNEDGTWTVRAYGSKNYNPLALMDKISLKQSGNVTSLLVRLPSNSGRDSFGVSTIPGVIIKVLIVRITLVTLSWRVLATENGQATRNTYFGQDNFETYLN